MAGNWNYIRLQVQLTLTGQDSSVRPTPHDLNPEWAWVYVSDLGIHSPVASSEHTAKITEHLLWK